MQIYNLNENGIEDGRKDYTNEYIISEIQKLRDELKMSSTTFLFHKADKISKTCLKNIHNSLWKQRWGFDYYTIAELYPDRI